MVASVAEPAPITAKAEIVTATDTSRDGLCAGCLDDYGIATWAPCTVFRRADCVLAAEAGQ